MNLKELTAKLEKTEARRACSLEKSGAGSWDWNIENNTLFLDDTALEIYGLNKSSFDGTSSMWRGLVVKEDLDLVDSQVKKCILKDSPYLLEFRINTSTGVRKISSFGHCVRNEEGKAVRLTGLSFLID